MVASGIDWSARSYDELCRRFRWSIPGQLNIATMCCDRHATQDRVALVETGAVERSFTFAELKDLSDRMALVLREMGVERGDRLAVWLPQRVENPLAHLAAFKLGAVSVPLSPLFRHDALRHRLAASRARVLVTDAESAPLACALSQELPDLETVIVCDEEQVSSTEWLWDALARTRGELEPVGTRADEAALLLYTSGTEGMPKGALHAHRMVLARLGAFELVHRLETERSQRPFYTPAEWAWVAGLVDSVLTPWAFGRPVLAHRTERFDGAEALAQMERARVRGAFLPPTALRRMRGAGDAAMIDASVHSAGEPLEPELMAWAQRQFREVHELYGMTEVGALVGSSAPCAPKPGKLGKPYPGREVVLLDDGAAVVEGAGEGVIAVHRSDPGLMLGYLDDTAGTEARFAGEWFVTGDIARRHDDGYLAYVGRADDVFNTSGYRVGPTEIERTLLRHPAVGLAAVVAEPDRDRGAVPKAFVVLAPGALPTDELAAELTALVRDELAAYQAPRRVVFARELPTTVTGKIRRSALRDAEADARWGLRPMPKK